MVAVVRRVFNIVLWVTIQLSHAVTMLRVIRTYHLLDYDYELLSFARYLGILCLPHCHVAFYLYFNRNVMALTRGGVAIFYYLTILNYFRYFPSFGVNCGQLLTQNLLSLLTHSKVWDVIFVKAASSVLHRCSIITGCRWLLVKTFFGADMVATIICYSSIKLQELDSRQFLLLWNVNRVQLQFATLSYVWSRFSRYAGLIRAELTGKLC